MKSALDDPPRKVADEAGVGLRERPQADGRARVHAAVRLPRSGRSSPVAAFLTVQHQEPLSNLNDYLKTSGEETVATISRGTAQAPFPTAQPEGCAHHTHVNPMAGVVQEAYGIHFQAIWATTSTTCTAHIIP